MFEFKMPDIGEGIAEAELIGWLVEQGEVLEADQAIAEVMTDKATVEITTPKKGIVEKLCFGEGDAIPVGEVFIVINDKTEGAPLIEPKVSKTEKIKPKTKAFSKNETQQNSSKKQKGKESVVPVPEPAPQEFSPTGLPSEGAHPPPLPPRPGHRLSKKPGIGEWAGGTGYKKRFGKF